MRPEAVKNLKNGVLIPAMPLVLDQNRMFDSKKQKRLVRYYLEAGAGGIAAAVHTTQFDSKARNRAFAARSAYRSGSRGAIRSGYR